VSSGRILIADDEPSVRDSVGYALAQEGFEVTPAADGDEALPPAHSREIAAGIAASRLEIIERAAHLPVIERPDAVAALILGHLQVAS